MGIKSEIGAMPASTDAWFYTNILNIPGLATGCGDLKDAHTSLERVALKDVIRTAAALCLFIKEWCGLRLE